MADTTGIEIGAELSADCSTIQLEHGRILRHVLQHWVGQRLIVSIRKFTKRRSDKQNRYMWGVMVTCVRAWMLEKDGHAPSKDAVYVWLRTLVGHELVTEELVWADPATGRKLTKEIITQTGKRFSQMSTKEFAAAVDFLRDYFLPLGCDIPEPKGDNLYSDYIEWERPKRLSS